MPANLNVLASFRYTDGNWPYGRLITDSNGNLFGVTRFGGPNDAGIVFEIAKTSTGYASSPIVLATFNGHNGFEPHGSLIADIHGNLFGTTRSGGANKAGTVFQIAKTSTGYASTPIVLASFDGSISGIPSGGLIADANGNLFGTTQAGYLDGAKGVGTVFEIAKTSTGYASTPTVLAKFTGSNGSEPISGVIADASGNLFGTTSLGGAHGYGTVFEIAKTSTGYASSPTVLVSFDSVSFGAPLLLDANGNLFGTTYSGGEHNAGAVFEIAKTSTGYASTPTVLASFDGFEHSYSLGSNPLGGLIADAHGNLFGTTQWGGAKGFGGFGTVFEIAKTSTGYASTPTRLVSFGGLNGSIPLAGLIADSNGNLFGTTSQGGAYKGGTVFEITGLNGVTALVPGFAAVDTTTGNPASADVYPYTGPVSDLTSEYINITSHNLNVSVSTDGWFIHTGDGTDGIAVQGGTNVLDGGTGSNFLTGGSGTDTFFVDARGAAADIWSTVVGFHGGDAATIWGVTPSDFGIAWVDGEGAAGFTGLTLHATSPGRPTASLTLAGYSQSDLNNGRLSVLFDTDPASRSSYMYVRDNG